MKKTITIALGAIIGTVFGFHACNVVCNDRIEKTDSYLLVSKPDGIMGHIEYVRYEDASQEVKEYSGFGHRIFGSEICEDRNGDSLTDHIRRNSGEVFMNRLDDLFVRSQDYALHAQDFDNCDQKIAAFKMLTEQK